MSTAVRDRVASLIDQLFGVPLDSLTDDIELQDGLQLDSLSVVELQMVVEDSFGIRLDGQQPTGADGLAEGVEDITTFGQLVDAVSTAVEAQTGRDRGGIGPAPRQADGIDDAEVRSA